jgi:hypothetical protein
MKVATMGSITLAAIVASTVDIMVVIAAIVVSYFGNLPYEYLILG